MSDITNNEETVEVTPDAVAPSATGEVEAVVETPTVAETPAVAAAPVAETAPSAPAPVVERKGPVIKVPVVKETKTVVEDGNDSRNNPRKVREGIVISNKMDMTLVVAVNERVRHPRYGKTVQRTKKLYVHDEKNDAKIGDRVRVQETRPLSKLKRWRLTEVVERAR
jgi:small subunit ribosomal protein S17